MSCIGTAGHVDHGKSALVKALTGIDPDRLAEEKERGMTIDLGFAWLKLPSGHEVSIVDVPGHESFIKNMLAGVGGIDAALLVVAADEGIMPQTREHLAILDLLRVPRGVVALTKADLVDEEWLNLVRAEVAEYLLPTTLAGANIIPVSSYTGQGLPELRSELECVLAQELNRQNIARPRLPIDRVFSLTGFGTIVTGTLIDGTFKTGQEVEVLPQGIKTRIRGLQSHKQTIDLAQPGQRVAINLANVARSTLERGNVVALPGQLHPTLLLDARIHLLKDAGRSLGRGGSPNEGLKPLSHNAQVEFYCGSQEVSARVRLLARDELLPGEDAWAQLRLQQPAVVARRDRFILRIPSLGMTIGGGEVVDVKPRYHRRSQSTILADLERLSQSSPEELVLAALDYHVASHTSAKTSLSTAKSTYGFASHEASDIAKQYNLAEDVTLHILETLLQEGRVCKVGTFWFARHVWETLTEEAIQLVNAYHQSYPLRSGLSKEEWRTRLHLSPHLAIDVFAVLQAAGRLETVADREQGVSNTSGLIRLPHFVPRFTPQQQQQIERLLQAFQSNLYTPPGRTEAESLVGPEVLNALIEQGRLVKLGNGVLFLCETYNEVLTLLIAYLRKNGTMTVAEARDILDTTRKYILPLLEQMDALRLTRRLGDTRVLGVAALDGN
jgi:selenocysteine-specific elongation factor